MGCDIHLHVEIKVNGQWHHYNHPKVPRNYALFAAMAGVRGEPDDAIATPRGIPTDATTTTRLDFTNDGTDAHTPSWLTCAEVGSLEDQGADFFPGDITAKWTLAKQFGWLFGNSFGGFAQHRSDYPAWLQGARVVFWFDN